MSLQQLVEVKLAKARESRGMQICSFDHLGHRVRGWFAPLALEKRVGGGGGPSLLASPFGFGRFAPVQPHAAALQSK